MDIWKVLDLEPTEDTSTIKKAYAKKLKEYHPEEDPEGFQRLKESYDAALKYAKCLKQIHDYSSSSGNNESPEEHAANVEAAHKSSSEYEMSHKSIEDTFNAERVHKNNSTDYESSHKSIEDKLNTEELHKDDSLEDFMRRLEELYKDFSKRIESYNWMDLLNSSLLWKLNSNEEDLGKSVLNFLIGHNNLPLEVLQLLNVHFQWFSTSNPHVILKPYARLKEYEEGVCHLQSLLALNRDLSFEYLREARNVDLESYLTCRQKAYLALQQEKIKDALAYVEQARKIYGEDPELMYLESVCLIVYKEFDTALKLISQVLNRDPYHAGALFCRGKLYYERKQYEQAVQDLSKIKSYDSIFREVPSILGFCYFNLKDYEKSGQYFNKALELNPKDTYIKTQFIKSGKQSKRQLSHGLLKNPFNITLHRQFWSLNREMRKVRSSGLAGVRVSKASVIFGAIFAIIVATGITIALISPNRRAAQDPELSPREMRVGLINPMAFTALHMDKEYEDSLELRILSKVPLKEVQRTTSDGLTAAAADTYTSAAVDKSSGKTSYGDVYLCQYGSKKTLIVLKKSTDVKNKYNVLICKASMWGMDKAYLNKIKVALMNSKVDTSGLITSQYLEVELNEAQLRLMDQY